MPLKSAPLLCKVMYRGTQAPTRKYVPKPALICMVGLLEDADTFVGMSKRPMLRIITRIRANTPHQLQGGTSLPYTTFANQFICNIVGAYPCGRPGVG